MSGIKDIEHHFPLNLFLRYTSGRNEQAVQFFFPTLSLKLCLQKLLQTAVRIHITSPALFAEMAMLMSKHTVSERKDSATRYRFLRSGQFINSIHGRFKFNNFLPHTRTLKDEAKNSGRVAGENFLQLSF